MLIGDYSNHCQKQLAPCSCTVCKEQNLAKYSKAFKERVSLSLLRAGATITEINELMSQSGSTPNE
jgi:hypothetical protein